jgi:hypothetical protein
MRRQAADPRFYRVSRGFAKYNIPKKFVLEGGRTAQFGRLRNETVGLRRSAYGLQTTCAILVSLPVPDERAIWHGQVAPSSGDRADPTGGRGCIRSMGVVDERRRCGGPPHQAGN